MMQVVFKTEGAYVDYALEGTRLAFRGGELALDLAELQRDFAVSVTVSSDRDGRLTTGASWRYVAEINIPARRSVMEKTGVADDIGFPVLRKVSQPLDTGDVVLTLWGGKEGAR